MCRVNIGHLRVTVGHCRSLYVGQLKVTRGNHRLICYLDLFYPMTTSIHCVNNSKL